MAELTHPDQTLLDAVDALRVHGPFNIEQSWIDFLPAGLGYRAILAHPLGFMALSESAILSITFSLFGKPKGVQTIPLASIRSIRRDPPNVLSVDLEGRSAIIQGAGYPGISDDKSAEVIKAFAVQLAELMRDQGLLDVPNDADNDSGPSPELTVRDRLTHPEPSLIAAARDLQAKGDFPVLQEWLDPFPAGVSYLAVVSSYTPGFAALTERHLHVLETSTFGKIKGLTSHPLDKIQSVSASYSMGLAWVNVTFGGPVAMRAIGGSQFRQPNQQIAQGVGWYKGPREVLLSVAEEFAAKVRAGIANYGAVPSAASDPLDSIRKLKELLDLGAITQDEFESKKQQYLR